MIIAHLSDLHLGHRAFDRSERGRNMRERDVSRAFLDAIERVIELRPDLIVIAGDVQDRPDLPPGVLVPFAQALERLHRELPALPVLLVAGLGDTPDGPDPGGLAVLDTLPYVDAATNGVRSVRLRELKAHVLLVPHRAVTSGVESSIDPDPTADWNVVVAYGRAEPDNGDGLSIDSARWDYIAFGAEHAHRRLAANAYYSGSLERVSTDPWKGAGQQKGFVTFDTRSRRADFHPVGGRPVVELAAIRARKDPADVNDRIRDLVEGVPGGLDGKLVRLRIEGLEPREQWALDTDLLTGLRARAGYLEVIVTPPRPPASLESDRAKAAPVVRAEGGAAQESDEEPSRPVTLRAVGRSDDGVEH